MLGKEFHISKLIVARLNRSLTAAEEAELQEWLDSAAQNRQLMEDLINDEKLNQKLTSYRSADKASIWAKTLAGIQEEKLPEQRVRQFRLPVFITAAAAAIALLVLGINFYRSAGYLQNNRHPEFTAGSQDVPPGKNGATLTLGNGKRILIKDALAGNIASESGVKISKTAAGQLVYEISGRQTGSSGYNTLTTGRGEQIQVRLPDGTMVYLNAASSLKYPVSFAKVTKRVVSLTGEGYFEVATSYFFIKGNKTKQSFLVKSESQEVEVLGTHFNVNTYGDDHTFRTTLLEGSIRLSSGDQKQLLIPGQQGILSRGELKTVPADVETAVAWKNNKFMFESESIQNIMKMVERWYDVDVVYEGAVPDDKFNGRVSKFDKVSKVLQILESSKKVHFKIEGRRITVSK